MSRKLYHVCTFIAPDERERSSVGFKWAVCWMTFLSSARLRQNRDTIEILNESGNG